MRIRIPDIPEEWERGIRRYYKEQAGGNLAQFQRCGGIGSAPETTPLSRFTVFGELENVLYSLWQPESP